MGLVVAFLCVLIGLLFDVMVIAMPCPNLCSSHGRCQQSVRQCECMEGYSGPDCSMIDCPLGPAWSDHPVAVDDAHNLAMCSNRGHCDFTTGDCVCMDGFTGHACDEFVCPSGCSGHGQCLSMEYYAKLRDPGEISSGVIAVYEDIWDANQIRGCVCDEPYFGIDCSLTNCPVGDDPMTGNAIVATAVNPTQVNEKQNIVCSAGSGSFTLTFRGKTTEQIAFNAQSDAIKEALEKLKTITEVDVSGQKACIDTADGLQMSVTFKFEFGDVPLMLADTKLLGGNTVTPQIKVTEAVKGTKENLPCSNRGVCDTGTGECLCGVGFDTSNGLGLYGTRGDCGYNKDNVAFCPGAGTTIACSGHGQCIDGIFKCSCFSGWQAADCSERICPLGTSWFTQPEFDNIAHISESVECSDMGSCDRTTGLCTCHEGFQGSNCNQMKCPGEAEECNGRGQCLTMKELAKLTKVNGMSVGLTYGEKPNDPLTWDANRIKGCYCDEGYEGYDCSMKTCPKGDNPDTEGQRDEQQRLICSHDGTGTLLISFRGQQAPALPVSASTSAVKAALESLDTLGEVKVEVEDPNNVNGDRLCGTGTNSFLITFLTEHGDLPDLQLNLQGVSEENLVVEEYLPGTKEMVTCSDRGLCDTLSGQCICFEGYGNSDGKGGRGEILDCGYIEPILKPEG